MTDQDHPFLRGMGSLAGFAQAAPQRTQNVLESPSTADVRMQSVVG